MVSEHINSWLPIARTFLFAAVFVTGSATAESRQSTLTVTDLVERYVGRTATLRYLTSESTLKIDRQGKVVGNPRAGDWTLDGRFEIAGIELRQDVLRITGNRIALSFENWNPNHAVRLIRTNSMKIEIKISLSPMNLENELTKVFLTQEDSYPDNLPAYWRAVICELGKGSDCRKSQPAPIDPTKDPRRREPVLKKQVSPSYTDVARDVGLTGVSKLIAVVDKTGRVRVESVLQPLGLGLDERAVKAIEAWMFTPGTVDGQAENTVIEVLLDFSLQ